MTDSTFLAQLAVGLRMVPLLTKLWGEGRSLSSYSPLMWPWLAWVLPFYEDHWEIRVVHVVLLLYEIDGSKQTIIGCLLCDRGFHID